jgi:hypothetical protein
MKFYSVLLILILSIFLSACKTNVDIVGEWKREVGPEFTNASMGCGNLSINSDSTFKLHGEESEMKIVDTIPGWHTGGSIKGKWQVEKNHLLFYLDEMGTKIPIRYEIVELTANRLVMLSTLPGNDTIRYSKLIREK